MHVVCIHSDSLGYPFTSPIPPFSSPSLVPHSHTVSPLFPAAVALACLDCCKLQPPVHIHACPAPLSSPPSPCLRHLICSSSSSPCRCHHHRRRRSRSRACFCLVSLVPRIRYHVWSCTSRCNYYVRASLHHFFSLLIVLCRVCPFLAENIFSALRSCSYRSDTSRRFNFMRCV